MKPIIGIVGRPNEIVSGYPVISTHESLRKAIIEAGGNPIAILPPQMVDYEISIPKEITRLTDLEKEMIIEQIKLCDGVIMPGGFKWYEYDLFIGKYLINNDIPTLGLCMGMQLLAYIDNMDVSGQTNIVKNETEIDHFQKGVPYVHDIKLMDNTILKEIYSTDILKVNSRHNYHVNNVNKMIVNAYSSDNLIEGIEFPSKRFIIGIQWHPETIINNYPVQKKLFETFVKIASKNH